MAWCVQCFGDLRCCVRGLRPLRPSGLPVTAQGLRAKRVEVSSSSPSLCGAGPWGGRTSSLLGPANLSIWETGGELVLFGRKWVRPLGRVLGRRDPSESVRKVLGLQVRSSGAPGALTLKEVEELEQLTQQLMQDMEHPQRQNVAASGEPPPARRDISCVPVLSAVCGPTPCPGQLSPCKLHALRPIHFRLCGFPRVLWPVSPAPGTCSTRGARSGAAVPHRLLYLPSV